MSADRRQSPDVERARLALARSTSVVARGHGWPPEVVRQPRGRQPKRASWLALYLARVQFGVPTRALAQIAGRDRRYVQRVIAKVEDMRDVPAVDDLLGRLESEVLQ